MLHDISNSVERLQAAAAARSRLTLKRSKDEKWNHARIIEFLKLYNEELIKRGLPADLITHYREVARYKVRYGQDPPRGLR